MENHVPKITLQEAITNRDAARERYGKAATEFRAAYAELGAFAEDGSMNNAAQ